MARVIYGPLVSSVKGSVGGTTFQSNASGEIIRKRPQVHKASTTKQTQAHARLQTLLSQWQTLTQAQRDAWYIYARTWPKVNKFGQSKNLTALNWFTSLNWWRTYLGSSIFTLPPVHTTPPAPPAFEMIFSDTAIKILFTEPYVFTENNIAIWCSLPTRRNTLTLNQIRKLIYVITAAPASPLDITTYWEAATGISWAPATLFPEANIFTCCESVSVTSCITSSFLCAINQTPAGDDGEFYYYC